MLTVSWDTVRLFLHVRPQISHNASYRTTLIVKLIVVAVSGVAAALHREQPAARPVGFPPDGQPGGLFGPGQVADLDPDQLGEPGNPDPLETEGPVVVRIFRRAKQCAAVGQLPEPFPGHGKADLQLHLIADEHPRISLDRW